MGLKATGSYLSRTLSYDGAEFSIARVEMDPTFGCALQGFLSSLPTPVVLSKQQHLSFACMPFSWNIICVQCWLTCSCMEVGQHWA